MGAGREQALSDLIAQPGEPQDQRLSEAEQKLLAKLLSDPTYFPVEYRTWLKNYVEDNIEILPSQIRGGGAGSGAGALTQLPAGIILPYAGSTVGADTLICDGRAISRTEYANLYDAIGTTWGAGDGSLTFNIPDLRDRALWGAGSLVGIGQTDGVANGARGGPNHKHRLDVFTAGAGAHGHSGSTDIQGQHVHDSIPLGFNYAEASGVQAALGSGGTSRYIVTGYRTTVSDDGAHGHNLSISNAADHQHAINADTSGGYQYDKPSFAGIRYVITTGKR